MTQNIFEPDGRAVPYFVEGSDDGPTLVLIPGRGHDAEALGTVSAILEEEGFRIVRVGYRADAGDATPAELAGDVLAVIDEVGLEHTWVGGHGFGGTVARELGLAHHERINGVLLLGVEDVDIALAPDLPVLIFQGSDDDVTPPANAEALRQKAPERVSITTVQGAGHLFPATHPLETAEDIAEYLDWD
ncbi:alpha/beta fold hydrolase [Microbacterium halophytorum]|uniref:alpha/beta fold hydrolase n=1 Tax=Microbacterium halophytorum TaxID=2067568 RepID=UPI000CFD339A|nr:alpha/beta hydrolase [Microbacterium halophytorum]